ncbi:MAG: GGDEF domain-containing protein [Candidatus Gastranaerophilales bacterium]|nr:GGDEF domain-containing protein [Candidatus Gastranaerophilales bacterium]
MKKIALIINASNFERQKNIVRAVHRALKSMGNFTLYVISNYGVFFDDMAYKHGEAAIYSLLDQATFDGALIEGNIGSNQLVDLLAEKLRQSGTPFVTINIETKGAPFLSLDSYEAGRTLIEHLIEVHHCTKINMVLNYGKEKISMQALKAYQEILQEKGIPYEEKRILYRQVSILNGMKLVHDFEELGIDDGEAVVFAHDVCAIGYCLELEKLGRKVPDQVRLCSLNHSTNSIVFRPDISGADRMDDEVSENACRLLLKLMNGEEISLENYYTGSVYFGESCGCERDHSTNTSGLYQQLIVTKVEAGNQVSRMMQFNDSLEDVESLDQLAQNIKKMMQGINCTGFFCCLNISDLKYIVNQEEDSKTKDSDPYDKTMVAITGMSKRTDEIRNVAFPLKKFFPGEAEAGDIFIFIPIHYKNRDYGYMVFLNEYFPVEVYNYRICHESIGSSLENLHRQMILKSSIKELNRLHMTDQMTGIYNRFALDHFAADYVESGSYSLAMMDMDGLKGINDNFGHLAGNHAICITASVIQKAVDEGDLAIRYGGDEFQVLSHNVDPAYWERLRTTINEKLAAIAKRQKLPFELGLSLGYSVSDQAHPFTIEESCHMADQAMYENKKMRKAIRR